MNCLLQSRSFTDRASDFRPADEILSEGESGAWMRLGLGIRLKWAPWFFFFPKWEKKSFNTVRRLSCLFPRLFGLSAVGEAVFWAREHWALVLLKALSGAHFKIQDSRVLFVAYTIIYSIELAVNACSVVMIRGRDRTLYDLHRTGRMYVRVRKYWNGEATSFVFAVDWRRLGLRSKDQHEKRV